MGDSHISLLAFSGGDLSVFSASAVNHFQISVEKKQ